MRDLLILAFKFPPQGGVGSRRWAKFAKHLSRAGRRVHVLTARYPWVDPSNWSRDVDGDPNIAVHRIASDYPAVLLKQRRTPLEFALAGLLRLLWTPHRFPLDPADGWERHALPAAGRILREHGVGTLVATGPPCTLLHTAALVKEAHPGLRLFLDYRDPWNGYHDYQFGGRHGRLPSRRLRERSVAMEARALAACDGAFTVTDDMRRDLAREHPAHAGKLHTLYNGYDPDDYPAGLPAPPAGSLDLVYMGRFGRDPALRPRAIELLAEALERVSGDPALRSLTVDVHSELDASFFRNSPRYPTIRERFRFHPLVPPGEVAAIVAAHAACLSINSPAEPHAFGTKIFDYLAVGRPILHLSEGGELSRLLAERGHVTARYDAGGIADALLRLKAACAAPPTAAGFAEFDLRRLTERLLGLLEPVPAGGARAR